MAPWRSTTEREKKALEDRIAAIGRSGSWPDILADLDSLTGKRFVVRAASRRQPGIACSRRRAAANRPRGRGPLNRPIRKSSAKPPTRRGLSLPLSYLASRTDGLDGVLLKPERPCGSPHCTTLGRQQPGPKNHRGGGWFEIVVRRVFASAEARVLTRPRCGQCD